MFICWILLLGFLLLKLVVSLDNRVDSSNNHFVRSLGKSCDYCSYALKFGHLIFSPCWKPLGCNQMEIPLFVILFRLVHHFWLQIWRRWRRFYFLFLLPNYLIYFWMVQIKMLLPFTDSSDHLSNRVDKYLIFVGSFYKNIPSIDCYLHYYFQVDNESKGIYMFEKIGPWFLLQLQQSYQLPII